MGEINKNIVPSEDWEQDKYCQCHAFRYPEKETMCPKCKKIVPSQEMVSKSRMEFLNKVNRSSEGWTKIFKA